MNDDEEYEIAYSNNESLLGFACHLAESALQDNGRVTIERAAAIRPSIFLTTNFSLSTWNPPSSSMRSYFGFKVSGLYRVWKSDKSPSRQPLAKTQDKTPPHLRSFAPQYSSTKEKRAMDK